MFERMIRDWFSEFTPSYHTFLKALLMGDVKAMNTYMNRTALDTFSYVDTGGRPSEFHQSASESMDLPLRGKQCSLDSPAGGNR